MRDEQPTLHGRWVANAASAAPDRPSSWMKPIGGLKAGRPAELGPDSDGFTVADRDESCA
jgi:hypothetical protein